MRKNKTPPLILLSCCLLFSGCFSFEPTYSKEKIEEQIVTLCKTEYNIEPRVWLVGETVWIYMPFAHIITKDIQLDKDFLEKLNKVMMGSSRVLLSMKPRPQFMAMVASDIKEYGLDYIMLTWIPDIVKYQMEFISRDEFSRRTVVKAKENILAINDSAGEHIEKTDIKMGDFLAEQIAQRIRAKFQDLKLKDYFSVERVSCEFKDYDFKLSYDIKKTKPLKNGEIDIQKEILKLIAYVIKEYEFKDFLVAQLQDLETKGLSTFNRMSIKQYLKKKP
ncbi:MAG: hypothetical protein WC658_00280 [Candidatus Omnitrophota bacterium]